MNKCPHCGKDTRITDEMREKAIRLWRIGREHYQLGEKQHGPNTLKDIERMTGIPHKTVWMIVNEKR